MCQSPSLVSCLAAEPQSDVRRSLLSTLTQLLTDTRSLLACACDTTDALSHSSLSHQVRIKNIEILGVVIFKRLFFFKSMRRKKIYLKQNFRFIYLKKSSVQLFPTIIKNNKPNLHILNTNNR